MRTADSAQHRWYGILQSLGIDKNYLVNRHGPCPCCGGRDRFRFDDKDGRGTFFCSQCGAGDGMDLAMRFLGQDFKTVAPRIDQLCGVVSKVVTQEVKTDPRIRLEKVRASLVPNEGINPVSIYLENRKVANCQLLKVHPDQPYYEQGKIIDRYPAMVAVVTSQDGKPLTYHMTYLTRDGKKAPVLSPKKVLPPVSDLSGAAIRLSPVSSHLGIAEGIETALAVQKYLGVPCWAACNSIQLEKFEPPHGVEKVSIYGDNDDGFEGQRAAYSLARRLHTKGFAVEVNIPDAAGNDYADILARTQA